MENAHRTGNSQDALLEEQRERILLNDTKTYYKALVVKIIRYRLRDAQIGQSRDPLKHSQTQSLAGMKTFHKLCWDDWVSIGGSGNERN